MFFRYFDILKRRKALKELIDAGMFSMISLADDRKRDFFMLSFYFGKRSCWSVIIGEGEVHETTTPMLPELEPILRAYVSDPAGLTRIVKPFLHRSAPKRINNRFTTPRWELVIRQKEASASIKLDEPTRQGATLTALDKEFMQVFAMKSAKDREVMIMTCMRSRKLTRDAAMQFLINDLRRDIRSWR